MIKTPINSEIIKIPQNAVSELLMIRKIAENSNKIPNKHLKDVEVEKLELTCNNTL